MSDEYPDKAICGLYGMYIQSLIDELGKPDYPDKMLRIIDDLHAGVKDMTYELCLDDEFRADLIRLTKKMTEDPSKENYVRIKDRVDDQFLASFMEEAQPGYTPGRETGSNRRY